MQVACVHDCFFPDFLCVTLQFKPPAFSGISRSQNKHTAHDEKVEQHSTLGPSYRSGKIPVLKSPSERGLSLQRPVFSLTETRLLYRSNPKSASRFKNVAGLEVAVSPRSLKCCAQDATRQHTAYILSPRKTRTDTHHYHAH